MEPTPRTSANLGCLGAVLAILMIVIPLFGHILSTIFIVGDDLTMSEKILWLLAVWLVPFVGILLYLLVGQKRNRLLSV